MYASPVVDGGGSELSYQVTLEPDRAALRRYGISAAQFTQAVAREVRGPIGRNVW